MREKDRDKLTVEMDAEFLRQLKGVYQNSMGGTPHSLSDYASDVCDSLEMLENDWEGTLTGETLATAYQVITTLQEELGKTRGILIRMRRNFKRYVDDCNTAVQSPHYYDRMSKQIEEAEGIIDRAGLCVL